MNILIVNNSKLPVFYYGGTERVIWCLGKTLTKLGHRVSFLVAQGSTCDFAKIIERNPEVDVIDQIPVDIDLVHFHYRIQWKTIFGTWISTRKIHIKKHLGSCTFSGHGPLYFLCIHIGSGNYSPHWGAYRLFKF